MTAAPRFALSLMPMCADLAAPCVVLAGLLATSTSAMGGLAQQTFASVVPCRVVDTRPGFGFTGAYGPPFMAGSAPRNFTVAGQCGIPATALSVVFNFTVTSTAGAGFLLAFPEGGTQPNVSTLNYLGNQTVANAAVVPLGSAGGITVIPGVSGFHLIADVTGYYELASDGHDNTSFGYFALRLGSSPLRNSAFGRDALARTNGNDNSGFGYQALMDNLTGATNTAVGAYALENLLFGSSNIAIGVHAGTSLTDGHDNIYIGNSVDGGVPDEHNVIRIGNATQVASYIGGIVGRASPTGVGVYVNGEGKLGSTLSSRRYKEGIADVGSESDVLMKLRPVSFYYRREQDDTHTRQYGLVAEDVAEVAPGLVAYDKDGRVETVRYHFVNALLLNEVQKQRRALEELKSEIDALRQTLAARSRPGE